MKNKKRNHKRNKSNKPKRMITINPNVKEIAELEKQGLVSDANTGFKKGLFVHINSRNRTISEAGRMPVVWSKNGSQRFEMYVQQRKTAGPMEYILFLRSAIGIMSRDQLMAILTKTPELIANPNYVVAIMRQLMEDGLMTMDFINEVLDYEHPAWSQLEWKTDDDLEVDFVEGFLANPENKGKRLEDAHAAFNALPTDLYRKVGQATVVVATDEGEQKIKVTMGVEKAALDRGRYFLAICDEGTSSFRTSWLKLSGWRNKPRSIEGRPRDHKSVGRLTPDWITQSKLELAESALVSADPEVDVLSALKAGQTVTF